MNKLVEEMKEKQINEFLDILYLHGNKNNISCLYDILKDENAFFLLKDYLQLPNIRKIDDKIFIKTCDYQSDGISRYKRFFIVLNKDGNILPSYNNQFVEIRPNFILLCGSYKNQIININEMELLYCTYLNKLELNNYIGDQKKYELKINDNAIKNIIDKIHDYAEKLLW